MLKSFLYPSGVVIHLIRQIGHTAPADVMAEERERHDQRHPPDRMILDEPEQFGAALAVE